MQIRNINRVITTEGDTSDIINVVMYAYDNDNDPQIKELADQLRADTNFETCRNIWRYLIENITYRADSEGTRGEMIKSPARLLHDDVGDCKSYSVFTAVILRYLGIPHFFRFASYTDKKEATHVYIIADGNICIDAVAHVQLNYDFNREVPYTYKADMANGRTKISYLAGLNAGLGNVQQDVNADARYAVWIGDENQLNITPGKAWLYGRYDLLSEMINISKSDKNTAALYDELSIIAALLWAYDFVQGDTYEFDKMLTIIAGMAGNGRFTSQSTNTADRDNWFAIIISNIQNQYETGNIPEFVNLTIYNDVYREVIKNNELPDTVGISGTVGAFTPIADALKKAGIYFIYLFIPESELKNYPAAVRKKRNTQAIFFNLIHKVDIFHNSSTVLGFFRAGIIARTGQTPENYIKSIKAQNVKVGSITLATVATIISIVLGLLSIIKAIWPNSAAAKYAVSSGAADFNNELYTNKKAASGSNSGSTIVDTLTSGSGLWLIAALGVTAVILKKNKSNE